MSDSFSPDGDQRINPDGTIVEGIQFRNTQGALIGSISTQDFGDPPDPTPTVLTIALAGTFPPLASIVLDVGAASILLLDGSGNSDFALKADLDGLALDSDLSDVAAALGALLAGLEHDYTPIDLFGAWEPYGAPHADPAFWVDPSGICHLRGTATNPPGGAVGTNIGAVPKPADLYNEQFLVAGSGPVGVGIAVVQVIDDPAGVAAFLHYTAGDTQPDANVALCGITYPT